MSGTHLDPGGNIHDRARLHICVMVSHLMSRKNVRAGTERSIEIGTGVVQAMEARDL